MGRLSSALRTELERSPAAAYFLLSIVVGGTTYRWSDVGLIDSADGPYEARVLSWGGSLRRGVPQGDNGLDLSNDVEVTLDDTDQVLTTLLQGATRHSVRGASVTIKLASPNVAAGSWFTVFLGRVETYSQPAPLMWTLRFSPNDLPLRRESIPKARISASDWPSSSVDARELPVPILYGRISSSNGANNGAISCPLVDIADFRYLVCAGWAKSVDSVYKDGVLVAASQYAITHPVVNGRQYTLIDFTSTQGSSSITCDATGYESVGDGTGTLIEDPADIIEHALSNWVFGDYRSGAWLSSAAILDAASFATTFFSDRGYKGSVYLSTKRRGIDVLNDLLKSFEAKACWTPEGKIALKVEDVTSWSYVTDHVIREDEQASPSLTHPTAQLVDEVEAEWAATPTGGYTQTLKVKDLATGEEAPEEIQLPFSPAFFL